MSFRVIPYNQAWLAALRDGGPDAYGQPAERSRSDGAGNPCRSCLRNIPEGAEMLIAAARPFSTLQPYAETGPVFFCADACTPWPDHENPPAEALPPVLTSGVDYLVKGYHPDERIFYGTGEITPAADLPAKFTALLGRAGVAFADVRSSRNNCFLARVIRADTKPG